MSRRTPELRSIALHRIVAERVVEDAPVVETARARVATWLDDGEPVPRRWALRWRQFLPFAGVDSDAERLHVIQEARRDAS